MEFDLNSLARLVQSSNTHNTIHQGRQIHLLSFKKGLIGSSLSFGNRLLQVYARCGSMTDAWKLFEDMPQRNCFSWNTMIEGYIKSKDKEKSLQIFNSTPHKNDFSWNVIISGFVNMGQLEIARNLFDDMPRKNVIVWNSMIHGYARNGCPTEALRLFKDLSFDPLEVSSQGDNFVLSTVIKACTDLNAVNLGKQIHARIVIDEVEFDSVLGCSLINMYGKCGDLESASHLLNMMKDPDNFSLSALVSGYANCGRTYDARRIFDRISNPCVVLWNSMISGYVSNSEEIEALALFDDMRNNRVREDSSTFASVLSASSSLGFFEHIKQIHSLVSKIGLIDDIIVASSLVDAYSKSQNFIDAVKLFSERKSHDTILLNSIITVYSNCGRIEDAKQVFATMPRKSLVSWNSMIVGLSQNGCPIEAINLLCKINKMGLKMDKFNIASVISSCGCISSLELGEQIFARAIVLGLESDPIISTSLVDFYCKCGLVENGRRIFDGMIKSDEIVWNSILTGYASNGNGVEALILFDKMRQCGVRPNDITFTGVLSACDHCGLVEEGKKWFNEMKRDYHIDPGIEHYSCMVDLYSRAGFLEEALNLIEQMPFDADISMWSSVLRGCVAHGDKNVAQKVAEKIIKLEPENSGAHVQLASIMASFGDWEESAEVWEVMREKKIQKNPGRSWGDCFKESLIAA